MNLSISGATVNGTYSNLVGLTDGSTGTFTLNSVVYDYSIAVTSGIATISITGDSNGEISTAQAEALLDAVRYQNTSENPTESNERILYIRATDNDGNHSNIATSTITVQTVNDAPILDNAHNPILASIDEDSAAWQSERKPHFYAD